MSNVSKKMPKLFSFVVKKDSAAAKKTNLLSAKRCPFLLLCFIPLPFPLGQTVQTILWFLRVRAILWICPLDLKNRPELKCSEKEKLKKKHEQEEAEKKRKQEEEELKKKHEQEQAEKKRKEEEEAEKKRKEE